MYWFPALVYAAFIFLLSSFSFSSGYAQDNLSDKIIHLTEYLGFGILLFYSLRKTFPEFTLARYYFLVIIIAGLYGFFDEVHQLFVPNREFSIYDILADVAGSCLGVLIYRFKFISLEKTVDFQADGGSITHKN